MWIRILAVGIVGLVGMGAVAALARDPAPAPIVEYPVAERAKKADRLSLVPQQQTVGTTSATAVQQPAPIASVPPSPPPAPQTKNIVEPPPVVARHRREATDPIPKKRKRTVSSKHQQDAQNEKPTRTVDCNGSGLDSVLRSMRLKPGCL
jgi:type IV secretory pathway VirB10-like protein